MRDTRGRLIDRLVALIVRARSGEALDLNDLAREHHCSTRTIRRDLEALERVMPVRWRSNAGYNHHNTVQEE